MKVSILHLYYDLMNLYGEIGNIKAIELNLKKQGIKVSIDNLSINDQIDFKLYDLIYIGCGTENNLEIVKKDMLRYKNDIKNFIENDKFVILTGNSTNLLIDIFNNKDYKIKHLDKRIVGDVILSSKYTKDNIIGFINSSDILVSDKPIFKTISGLLKDDGICYKNMYATNLLGPVLIRNPELLEYILTKFIKSKDSNFKIKNFGLSLEKKAYDSYMNTYHSDK